MNSTLLPVVLIVEDVNSDIDVLNHILKSHYEVLVAKSGETALKMAVEHQPDLILLDIILPDMTGFSVLSGLKESNLTRGIPVIILTGINNAQYEEKGLSLGAVDYITKPFHNTVVLARIKTHIRILHYIRTIEQLGLIDSLTGLPNERNFLHQLEAEWGRATRDQSPLGLLVIDIDNFVQYNQTHGQPQGDILLQWVAQAISESLKRPADTSARLKSDEFAVLLPNTDKKGAASIAEEIRCGIETMSVPCPEKSVSHSSTVCIGVVSFTPKIETGPEGVIVEAEKAIAEAKKRGPNSVYVFSVG